MIKFILKSKIREFLGLGLTLLFTVNIFAVEPEQVLPFNNKHLGYPNFKAELEKVSSYIKLTCVANEDKLDPSIKDDYLITCQFPQLIAELQKQTDAANKFLTTDNLQIRPNAMFLDLEYGWINQDLFSLDNNPGKHLVNILILKQAVQNSIPAMSRLWRKHYGQSSLEARFYTLPKIAAAMERDLLLTRTLHYAKNINCISPQEVLCQTNKESLLNVSTSIIHEYRALQAEQPTVLNSYIQVSGEFRTELREWLLQNESPRAMLAAVKNGSSLAPLMEKYKQLIRIPKTLTESDASTYVQRLNVIRYLNEQDYLQRETNDNRLTGEAVKILTNIKKQMEKFFPNEI